MDSNRKDRREFLRSSLGTAAVAAAWSEVAGPDGDHGPGEAEAGGARGTAADPVRGDWTQSRAHQRPMPGGHARRRRAGVVLREGARSRRGVRQGVPAGEAREATSAKSSKTSRFSSSSARRSRTNARRSASRAMKHGKDFMSDKPGMTTLEQLAEVKKVQAEDEADLFDPLQRAPREPRDDQGGRAGQGRRTGARRRSGPAPRR